MSVLEEGFTLVELLVVLMIVSVVATMAYPHINSALDEAGYVECQSRLEMLRRAKTAYVLDHLELSGGAVTAVDNGAVFRAYLPQRFDFVCPRNTSVGYTAVYDLYSVSTCPYCSEHPVD